MPSEGIVREWSDQRGWGVIDSADTPGGCWVHFSHIVSDGLGTLTPGDMSPSPMKPYGKLGSISGQSWFGRPV